MFAEIVLRDLTILSYFKKNDDWSMIVIAGFYYRRLKNYMTKRCKIHPSFLKQKITYV